ncbi:hypothetical protein O0L34_g10273 [Tuta absoluta]|nr:hypothetical protein O0L34_g10273 [Tuta absoluta]
MYNFVIYRYIENTLRESLKEDKGTGCDIPKLNPFAAEIMQFDKRMPEIVCSGHDWVKCYFSKCTIDQKIIDKIGDQIECTYNDILYKSDTKYTIGPPTVLQGNQVYMLQKSDHVKIKCKLGPNIPNNYSGEKQWSGHGIGYRPLTPLKPPRGRENTFNVLIFGFDSTSKNGFIRKMPKSYKFLTEELDAVVLNG